MKRGLAVPALVAACLLGVGAAAGGPDGRPAPKQNPAQPAVKLARKDPNFLVLTAPGYRLTLSKENGELLELIDRRKGERLLRGQNGCWWAAKQTTGEAASGCAFGRTGDNRFTFRWSQLTSTLTMSYDSAPAGPGVDAVVTLVARSAAFDVRLELDSSVEYPLSDRAVPRRPAPARGRRAGRVHAYVPARHPSDPQLLQGPAPQRRDLPVALGVRGLLSADIGKGHIAMYSMNPAPKADRAGRHRLRPPRRGRSCGGPSFCATHVFQTWVERGQKWTSPQVRVRVGGTVEQSLVRLPRGQRHRQVPVARGKGRVQARQARPRAADQGRPLEGATRVQPVGGSP